MGGHGHFYLLIILPTLTLLKLTKWGQEVSCLQSFGAILSTHSIAPELPIYHSECFDLSPHQAVLGWAIAGWAKFQY